MNGKPEDNVIDIASRREEKACAHASCTPATPLPSRQVRRAEERAVSKLQHLTEQAAAEGERALATADKRMASLMKMRHMLFALIRATGRVRVTKADLERVTDRDKLDVKVQPNGDLMVTFLDGAK